VACYSELKAKHSRTWGGMPRFAFTAAPNAPFEPEARRR
jgi:hypothetical protein